MTPPAGTTAPAGQDPQSAGATTPEASPVIQTIGSIVSAVLLTTIVKALGASPEANLVAAVLGVAIPQFVTYVGPRRHIRLGVAIVVTIIALVLTYGGFKLFDAAADTTTFPDPVPTATPTPTGPSTPAPQPGPHIAVTPEQLHCTAAGCDNEVTIASTGTGQLRTFNIEFEGPAADLFSRTDECVEKTIPADAPCRFTVTFHPTSDQGTVNATLAIHQNVGQTVNRVPVEGSGGPVAATGNAAFDGQPTCTRENGTLVVNVTATADTPGQLPVSVSLSGGGPTIAEESLTAGEPDTLTLPEDAAGATVTLRLAEIENDDPSNNAVDITCAP